MSRPKFVRKLSKVEMAEVRRLGRPTADSDGRVVRRAQVVRLSALGKKVPEIALLLDLTAPTVHSAIDGFNQHGVSSFRDKPRPGRPPRAGPEYVALLKEAVMVSPADLGYPFASWTLGRLREHVGRKTGVLLHPDHLGKLCARHDIVYRRPRHLMAHLQDPVDYETKRELLEFLKKGRPIPDESSNSSSRMSVKFTCTQL